MGMFNSIILKDPIKCPKCGAELSDWQSKDVRYSKYPVANMLMTIILNSRINCEAHTFCDNCGEWVDLEIKKGKIVKQEHHPTPHSA